MRNKFLWLLAFALCITVTACTKDAEEPIIKIPAEFTNITLSEGVANQTITFEANQSWSASINDNKMDAAQWLTVSPVSGDAGKVTLTITAQDNYSQLERSTYIHIVVDGLSRTIPVKQSAGIPLLPDDEAAASVASKGFYVVNEDWFGHDNGTVNYFLKEGNTFMATYRAYRAVNTNESDWFGTSTQYATIWGSNAYFCSKQGNRLVVADAGSLKKRAVITDLGGDGRSFVGVDDTKGYVGHANGIAVFDIEKLQIIKQIDGVSGQIGTMCFAEGRVFAVSQRNGVYVINTKTDMVEQTIDGSFNTLTRSKDGDVWIAASNKLIRVNPVTLEKEELAYPAGASVGSSWGAWNAGSLCASTQQNVIYWSASSKVVKYDVDTRTANTALYTLGKSEDGEQLAFYGAGLRVDPLTDDLILTVKHSGWGASGAYNWVYRLNSNGQQTASFKVRGDNGTGASWAGDEQKWDGKYFWFPAMPFFEDANKPQILINQILMKTGQQQVIELDEKVVDYDNAKSSIQRFVTLDGDAMVTAVIEGGRLIVTAGGEVGKSSGVLSVISNGVRVDKAIRIDVEKK